MSIHPIKQLILGLGLLLLGPLSYAQVGSDPAVTSRNLQPNPLAGVGSAFTLSFSIGNAGAVAISGADAANRMGFTITLSNAAPNPLGVGALSGALLNYFDITYDPVANAFNGVQKLGVVIPRAGIFPLTIASVVTTASPVTNNIGAMCQIAPNSSSGSQPTGDDLASIYTHTDATLPVALVWFKAEAQTNRSVTVSWQTSMESGNKGYTVERSKDLTSFEPVGELTDVAGTSKSLTNYQLNDPTPYRGTSYYRLKQLDLSGTTHTYGAVAVSVDGVYGVYPNPVAATGFTLQLDEPTTAVIHLYTASGQAVNFEKSVTDANSVWLTPTSKLTAGIYVLTVGERAQLRQHRLVVQ